MTASNADHPLDTTHERSRPSWFAGGEWLSVAGCVAAVIVASSAVLQAVRDGSRLPTPGDSIGWDGRFITFASELRWAPALLAIAALVLHRADRPRLLACIALAIWLAAMLISGYAAQLDYATFARG